MGRLNFAAGLAALTMASTAGAQSYEGARIEGHVGYDRSSVSLGGGIGKATGDGVVYGFGAGYDASLGKVTIGPEVNLDFSNTYAVFRGTQFNQTHYSRDIEASLRIGALLGSSLVYAKAGYLTSRAETIVQNVAYRGNAEGLRLGLGLEQRLAGRVYGKLEYRYTDYSRFEKRHQALAGVGVRF